MTSPSHSIRDDLGVASASTSTITSANKEAANTSRDGLESKTPAVEKGDSAGYDFGGGPSWSGGSGKGKAPAGIAVGEVGSGSGAGSAASGGSRSAWSGPMVLGVAVVDFNHLVSSSIWH